jgi:hypothetical protein
MKKVFASLLAVATVAAAVPAVAAPWQNINQRQANLDRRIDQGVRSGQLTRTEAANLRAEFRTLARLEARYRATNGLSTWERRDLDARFDRLSMRIKNQRSDWDRNQHRGYRR